jgi:O-antigen/teichoic acid export membrane protein
VLSALVDITWLFYGLENFKSIVFKNIFVKIIELVLIFVFVKTKDDLWIYTLIVSCALFAGQALMIPQAIRLVKPIKFSFADIKEHVKPLLVLFISVIAATLYTVFDKTLLGILSPTIDDVAFYEYSNRITQVPRSILAVVITVMFPRACAYVESNDFDSLKKIIRLSTILVSLFGSAFMFGLMAISDKLSIVYYGDEFSVCGKVIMMMSPLIWIVYIGEILRSEYLVPAGKDFIYVLGIIISAVINISLSSILIPYLGINGAIIGSVSAEVFGLMYALFVTRKIYSFLGLLRDSVPFLLVGLTMGAGIYFMDRNTPQSALWLILEILVGGVYYLLLMVPIIYFFYRDIWIAFVQKISAHFKKGKKDEKN